MKGFYSGLKKPPVAGTIKILGLGDGHAGYKELEMGNYGVKSQASSRLSILIESLARSGEAQTASTRSP
jgi:hypothetical protein